MADQAQRRQSNCRSHASYLAILAFDDGDFQPTRRNRPANADRWIARPDFAWFLDEIDRAGKGYEVAEGDAATQAREVFGSWRALDLRPVTLFEFAGRMGDGMLQSALRGKQEQALTVGIEPSRWINVGQLDVIGKGRMPVMRRKLAYHPKRLVEGDEPWCCATRRQIYGHK